jgi:hypothetical protein
VFFTLTCMGGTRILRGVRQNPKNLKFCGGQRPYVPGVIPPLLTWVVKVMSKKGEVRLPALTSWKVTVANLTLGVLTRITVRAKTKMTSVRNTAEAAIYTANLILFFRRSSMDCKASNCSSLRGCLFAGAKGWVVFSAILFSLLRKVKICVSFSRRGFIFYYLRNMRRDSSRKLETGNASWVGIFDF